MNPIFQNIFIQPSTQESLFYNPEKEVFTTKNGEVSFPIQNGIPLLIEKKQATKIASTEVHNHYKTNFDYQEHYQKDADYFDYFTAHETAVEQHENRRLHENILSHFPSKSELILDVGCGNGWAAKALLPKGKKVISMDISTTNPKKVAAVSPHKNHLGLVADVFSLPVKKESIDTIIAAEIMEHVADPKSFVQILFERLKPGGRLIITTPYNEKRQYSLCVHCNHPTPHHAHLHSFHEGNIEELIPENCNWKFQKFSNKYLAKLRLHPILKYLPFGAWKMLDGFSNSIIKGELRMLLMIEKKLG